jgi:hypothetical protein
LLDASEGVSRSDEPFFGRFHVREGGASGFGGLLIFVSGYQQAGGWAMGIGTAMVVFEVAAIVGAAVRESSDRQMHE